MAIRVSIKLVSARRKKIEEPQIAKYLQLLANFVVDVSIVGVKSGEFVGVSIDIGQREGFLTKRTDDVKDVEGPAATI